jgi:hypothetical protein
MSFRQLDIYKDSKNICLPIAMLRLAPDVITERYGITFVDDCDDLDCFKGAVIAAESGRRFGLVYYKRAPEPRGTEIWAYEHSTDLTAELADFAAALPVPPEDYLWIRADAQSPNVD